MSTLFPLKGRHTNSWFSKVVLRSIGIAYITRNSLRNFRYGFS